MRFPNHDHRSIQLNGVHFGVGEDVDGGLGVTVNEVVDDVGGGGGGGGCVLDGDEGRDDGLGCGGH
jgi:hypothetical protein